MSNAQSIETTDQAKDDSSECCISGVCDYHNARNIAAADHALFVADARRHYVPAIRWARANGWNAFQLKDGADIEIHLGEVWHGGTPVTMMSVRHVATDAREPYYPTSVKQAIDFLVTAGVLPVELASWASVDGITATMRALHMTAIDLRPAFEGVGEAS